MDSMVSARLDVSPSRRGHRFAALGVTVAVVMVLATVLSACGSSTPAPAETQAPAPPAAAAFIGPVWAQVGAADAPLFGLVVTETQGFSAAERKYLRSVRVAWSAIGSEATEYAALADSGADPAEADKVVRRIERRAETAAFLPSPSSRFSMLHDSVRFLMRRVVRMAELSQDFAVASDEEQKAAIASRLERIAASLPAETLRVADWGVEMRNRYGAVFYAAVSAAPVTPTTSPQPEPQPNPEPEPQPEPKPTPAPKPAPPLTNAEAQQVAELEDLDLWLTSVVDEAEAAVESENLPWSDAEVESFRLNMGYLQDQCDLWLAKSPAGSRVAAGFKQYLKGLSLIRKGARQLDAAAEHNDADHQKALNAGNATLESAAPDLRHGMAKLEALR